MEKEKVDSLIEWWGSFKKDHQGVDFSVYMAQPLMEAFGEDVNEILEYLNSINEESLLAISGCFEDIYRKFTTDEVWDALEALEQKIT